MNTVDQDQLASLLSIRSENIWYKCIVNIDIFARVLFSRNSADAKFRENKPSRNY